MATTLTVQDTANWASPFTQYRPLAPGVGSEPAITSANTILCAMLAPPFRWSWNRNNASFATSAGIQDYLIAIPDFRFVENVSISSTAGTFSLTHLNTPLPTSSEQLGRPAQIATQLDDNAGNITFRFSPVPDGIYTVTLTYQRKANLIASLASTWSPIPDEFSFIFNYGFLSMMLAYADDARFQIYNQKFVSSLLSVAEGLSEQDRNIFVGNWMLMSQQQQAAGIRTQQAAQARGSQ